MVKIHIGEWCELSHLILDLGEGQHHANGSPRAQLSKELLIDAIGQAVPEIRRFEVFA